jgi:hypothetical protein
MMKVHMGVYSNDAFTNNLHEVFTYVNCTAGRYVELKFLHPFGEPGRFITPDRCLNGRTPFRPDPNVLKVTPPDSPSAAGERMVPDKVCAKYLFTKHEDTGHLLEHWVMGQSIKMRAKVDGKFEYGVTFGPYFNVFNPIRFYDPDMKKGDAKHPSYIGYFSELCWSNSLRANGSRCQQLRKEYPNSPADSWKSCNSPYKGTIRRFSPNGLSVFTPPGGPHAMYTNVFFKDARLQEFPFAIKQMLGSNPDSDPMGGLSTDVVNFDSPSVCGEN